MEQSQACLDSAESRQNSTFRQMRRKRQQLTEEESIAILQKATAGTLALLGDNDYPYAVPISYVYHDGKLYFHSALAGPDAWQPLQSEPGRSPAERDRERPVSYAGHPF